MGRFWYKVFFMGEKQEIIGKPEKHFSEGTVINVLGRSTYRTEGKLTAIVWSDSGKKNVYYCQTSVDARRGDLLVVKGKGPRPVWKPKEYSFDNQVIILTDFQFTVSRF
jgi:hypothetical protein